MESQHELAISDPTRRTQPLLSVATVPPLLSSIPNQPKQGIKPMKTNPKIEDAISRFDETSLVTTKAYVPEGADALKPVRRLKRYAKGFAAELPEGCQLMALIEDTEKPPYRSLAVVVLVEAEKWMKLHAELNYLVEDYFDADYDERDNEAAILHTYGVREDGSWTAFD